MKRCNLHYENVHLLQSSVLKASFYFQCSTALIASTWHLMTGQQIYSSSSWFPVLGHLIHLDIWDSLTIAGVGSTGLKVNTLSNRCGCFDISSSTPRVFNPFLNWSNAILRFEMTSCMATDWIIFRLVDIWNKIWCQQ